MAKLEVVPDNRSGDYLLLADGELLSQFRVEFRHQSKELLENIVSEWHTRAQHDSIDLNQIGYLTLFCLRNIKLHWKAALFRDPALLSDSYLLLERMKKIEPFIAQLTDVDLPPRLREILDVLSRYNTQLEEKLESGFQIIPKDLERLKPVKDFLQEHGIEHPEVMLHRYLPRGKDELERVESERRLQSLAEQFGGFLTDGPNEVLVAAVPEYPDAMKRLTSVVEEHWSQLSDEQQSTVWVLQTNHGSMILALLLAMGRCSPSDYALAMLASEGEGPLPVHRHEGASAGISTADEAVLKSFFDRYIEEHGEAHDDDNQARYNQILGEANIAVDYLRLCENPVMALIRCGESKDVEFKSSFRWSFKEGKINEAIKTATLKSIVAFLNSGGGTLLLGVSDNGSIVGTEHDRYRNQDEYHRALVSSISDHIGPKFVDAVKIHFRTHGHHEIIAIECKLTSPPEHAFLDDKELYVRQGPMSICLTGRQLADWLRGH